jgi:type I restriction-modification system DNA methylase subunit
MTQIPLFKNREKIRPYLFDVDTNYQTPIKVCKYMVEMVPEAAKTILEPTPGIGNIVSVLESKHKYSITAADDFFLLNNNERFDCIVGNPPFSSKSAFTDNAPDNAEVHGMKLGYYILKQCMEMSNNVIMLMPWYTISDSDVRMRYLKEYGIKSLTALPRKTFQYARIQTVVIELEKGFKGETIFKTFEL